MRYTQALDHQLKCIRWLRGQRAPGGKSPQDVKRRLSIVAELETAETFYWAPEIVGVINDVSHSLPGNWGLRLSMLPTRRGFSHLAEPLYLVDSNDTPAGEVLAIAWAIGSDDESGDDAVSVSAFWYEKDLDRSGLTTIGVSEGEPIAEVLRRVEAEATTPFSRLAMASAVLTFSAGLAFLEQRIMVPSVQPVERHARKRMEREQWLHEPLVRVVELRRKQAPSQPDGEHTAVDWACQWVVRGHWRQQWYPSLKDYQPRWIMPYVKGPEDKPLKPPRAKIFAVVR